MSRPQFARLAEAEPGAATLMRCYPSTVLLLLALVGLPTMAQAQAQAQPANPYTLAQLVVLLEGGFSAGEVLRRVGAACISFRLTPAAEAELRKAGADDALLRELRSVCFLTPTPPPPRGMVAIIGELPPGWSRTVNDLPPSTNREIDLTPGRPAIITVTAPGWCPDRREVTLAQGDTVRWTPVLRGRPWVGGC
jgi:hypothetical protein